MYNVKDYGAAGDGITVDTSAIQRAIDECCSTGGGRVYFPSGKYIVGKLYLKDHVTVEIGEGAVVLASTKMEDYPVSDGPSHSPLKRSEEIFQENPDKRWAVFYACGAQNITVCGKGTVDGRFKDMLKLINDETPRWMNNAYDFDRYRANGFRPFMINFEDCRNIKLYDINFTDSPFYTTSFRSCTNICIRNVRILSHIGADNADGLHFHSCSDVLISDCQIETGDDSIAIDSNDGTPSERYAIHNCILSSRNNCFRIYTSLIERTSERKALPYGYVRDVVINNCVIKQGSAFLCINADNGRIERISVSNACGQMTRLGTAFVMTAHSAEIRDVSLSGCRFICRGAGYIYSNVFGAVSNIVLKDICCTVEPRTKLYGHGFIMPVRPESDLPQYYLSHFSPYFLQITNVRDIEINGYRIEWGETDIGDLCQIDDPRFTEKYLSGWLTEKGNWPQPHKAVPGWPAVLVSDTEGLRVNGLWCSKFGNEIFAVRLLRVKNAVFFRYGSADGGDENFLECEGCDNVNINPLL